MKNSNLALQKKLLRKELKKISERERNLDNG
jgi:hypothetical protein